MRALALAVVAGTALAACGAGAGSDDGVLTISGERKHERENKEGQTFRSERYFGKFQRSITLPSGVDMNKVTASYKDGVLLVHLPKAEEAKPRQIEVNVH